MNYEDIHCSINHSNRCYCDAEDDVSTGTTFTCIIIYFVLFLLRSCDWTLIPGCLAPQGKEEKASAVLNALVMSSGKDALSLLNKHVSVCTNIG